VSRHPKLFSEFALRDSQPVLSGTVFALGNRPGADVLVSPDGPPGCTSKTRIAPLSRFHNKIPALAFDICNRLRLSVSVARYQDLTNN
jgi:hypothetical protein